MTVWAAFLCIASIHQCMSVERVNGPTLYPTRAACEQHAAFLHRDTNETYRCFSKHVDTWQ